MRVDKALIKDILLRDKAPKIHIDKFVNDFPDELDNRLGDLLMSFVTSNIPEDFEYDGVSLFAIMKARMCKYLYALKLMNDFLSTEANSENREKIRRLILSQVYIE